MKYPYRACLTLLLLGACNSTPPVVEQVADYLPFEDGRTWVYEISTTDAGTYSLSNKSIGRDVRSLHDEERVVFKFVYGTPAGMDQDITKSIYALRAVGPCEYYFDAMTWALWHDPPIPLIPAGVAVGSEVDWAGKVEFDANKTPARARILVDARERLETPAGLLDTLRVQTSYEGRELEVTRWFARGIGMVRVEARGEGQTSSAALVSHSTEDS